MNSLLSTFLVAMLFSFSGQAQNWQESSESFQLSSEGHISVNFVHSENKVLKLTGFEIQGQKELTIEDQKVLVAIFDQEPKSSFRKALLEALINMLPLEEPLPSFNLPVSELLDFIQLDYKSICHKVGESHPGQYTANGRQVDQTVPIGFQNSECYGRCGYGCGMLLYRTKYTQECLNHDICNRDLDSQFGECADEFWAAVDGFFNAPSCEDI